MEPDDGGQAAVFDDLGEKQVYGPTKPAHAWPKPWTNLETQEHVQVVKAASGLLQEPLRTDMGDDEIFVGKDSIHILKHHGSYMQQDRSLKGKDKQHSYQFMLRLKMPCGEAPALIAAVFKSCSPSLPTRVHWALHIECRASSCLSVQLCEGRPGLAPSPRVCGEVYLTVTVPLPGAGPSLCRAGRHQQEDADVHAQHEPVVAQPAVRLAEDEGDREGEGEQQAHHALQQHVVGEQRELDERRPVRQFVVRRDMQQRRGDAVGPIRLSK